MSSGPSSRGAPFAVWVNVEASPAGASPAIYDVGVVVVDRRLRWKPGLSLRLPVRQSGSDWVDEVMQADPALAERYRRSGLIRDVKSAPLDLVHTEQAMADLVRPHGGLRLIVQNQATMDALDRRTAGMRRKFLRAVERVGPPILSSRLRYVLGAMGATDLPDPASVLFRRRAMFDLSQECERVAGCLEGKDDEWVEGFWCEVEESHEHAVKG